MEALPLEMLVEIVTRLATIDAVTASATCTNFQYAWNQIRVLSFDSTDPRFTRLSRQEREDIISRATLRMPFLESLRVTDHGEDWPSSPLQDWIKMARHTLRRLEYDVGDSLEALDMLHLSVAGNIERLSLSRVKLTEEDPVAFRFLRSISFRRVTISDGNLNRLIRSCPTLEVLEVIDQPTTQYLDISAPRLKQLHLERMWFRLSRLSITKADDQLVLQFVRVSGNMKIDVRLKEFSISHSNVTRVRLCDTTVDALEIFELVDCLIMEPDDLLRIMSPKLKRLRLVDLVFPGSESDFDLGKILSHCPLLRSLSYGHHTSDSNIYRLKEPSRFTHLKVLEVGCIDLGETSIVEDILRSCPSLESLKLKTKATPTNFIHAFDGRTTVEIIIERHGVEL